MIKFYGETQSADFVDEGLASEVYPEDEFTWVATTTRKSVDKFSFYFIAFKGDEKAVMKYGPINQQLAASNFAYEEQQAKGITPFSNLWQVNRQRVWPNHLLGLDMAYSGPSILVSEKFKSLCENEGISGVMFEPCLLEGLEYPDSMKAFGGEIVEGLELADCYQMVITSQAGPLNYGAATFLEAIAGNIAIYYDSAMPTRSFYRPESLRETDVQASSSVEDILNNEVIKNESAPVFSSKFLKLILDNKLKGILSLNRKPKIDFLVVPVRTEPYDDAVNHGHWDKNAISEYLAR